MFATPSLIAATATLLFSQSLAAAIPDTSVNIVPRGGGIPASNGPGMTCYNSWETVTNDPVVQYWYIVIPDAENSVKADRMWNHLNLNDCAPTEHKYYVEDDINGCALTFHASEACTAEAVSHAIRSSSDPAINVACQFNGKSGPSAASLSFAGFSSISLGVLAKIGAAFLP